MIKKYILLFTLPTYLIAQLSIVVINDDKELLKKCVETSIERYKKTYEGVVLLPEVQSYIDEYQKNRFENLKSRKNTHDIIVKKDGETIAFFATHEEENCIFIDTAYLPKEFSEKNLIGRILDNYQNTKNSKEVFDNLIEHLKIAVPNATQLVTFTPKMNNHPALETILQSLYWFVGLKKTNELWTEPFNLETTDSWQREL